MTGTQYIKLHSKRTSYNLELKRKITIIQGNSGTGKSSLVLAAIRAIQGAAYTNDSSKDIDVINDVKISNVIKHINNSSDYILIIDEETPGISSHEFADAVNKSDCYFVIIYREPLSNIPYSVDSVYELVTLQNKEHILSPLYSDK